MNKKILLLIILTMSSLFSCYDLMDTYEDYKAYNLRDRGPAGGWIFYINPNYKTDGWRYMEAAPADASSGLTWLSVQRFLNVDVLSGGTSTSIGSGKNNTAKILQYKSGDAAQAAQYCDELAINGYSDWFLPSKNELYEMCWVLHSRRWNGTSGEDNPAYGSNRVGGFSVGTYWSSSETNEIGAEMIIFGDGSMNVIAKDLPRNVRAIRQF